MLGCDGVSSKAMSSLSDSLYDESNVELSRLSFAVPRVGFYEIGGLNLRGVSSKLGGLSLMLELD